MTASTESSNSQRRTQHLTEFLHQPGFFGTAANFAADFTLVVMLIAAALFSIGFALARLGKYEAHRWVQTSAATISTIMVLWMMILPFRDFIVPGIPEQIGERFYLTTVVHALLGVVALPYGLFVALRGNNLVPNRLKFNNYKPYMRTAYVLYILVILLGIGTYLAWFVFNPNPPVFE